MAVVEVICKNLKNNPHCPHGPTLKFVRVNNGARQEFFACSTYRNRKDCGFYLVVGDKLSEKIQQAWSLESKKQPCVDHDAMKARLEEVKEVPPKDRFYCHTCEQLDVMDRRNRHKAHKVQSVISDQMLSHPSQILNLIEGSKKEAQFLFSSSTTQVIIDNLERADVSKVLCLGTPSVHEHIQSLQGSSMESLLLDFDYRYHSFWTGDKFIWYNMFNRHFLSPNKQVSKYVLRNFLSTEKQGALVVDPPFGGHVDPLAASVKHFSNLFSKVNPDKELKVIWIFPYFRERHISERCPTLLMSDYKVEYNNHKEFNNGEKGRRLGSPVRLFTNIEQKLFVLPKSEGYRLCKSCSKWVSAENKHCNKCNTCTSKDGQTYMHCSLCRKCVKSRWQHCTKCQTCLPTEHLCLANMKQSSNLKTRHKRFKKMRC